MADSVKVTGLKELGDAFNLAPQNLERRIMANATRAGGRVLEEAVRSLAPVQSGELARKVEAKFRVIPKGKLGYGIGYAVIGVLYERIVAAFGRHGRKPSTEDPGVYALFVEFGRPNRKGHTNQAAHPFMRPAFDGNWQAALNAFADKVRSQLGDLVK